MFLAHFAKNQKEWLDYILSLNAQSQNRYIKKLKNKLKTEDLRIF